MAIAYIGISTPATGVAGTATPTWPSAYTPTAGHYAIIVVANGPFSGTTADDMATPSGWTLLARNNDIIGWDGAAGDQSVFGRILAGGDTLTAFTGISTSYVEAYTIVFSGVDATTPMDATPVTSAATSTGSPSIWQPTGITTVTADAHVLSLFDNPRYSQSPTGSGYVANSFTNILTTTGIGDRGALATGRIVRATAGAQSMPTYAADSEMVCHIALALRPAGASVSFIAQNRIDANTAGWTLAEPTGTALNDLILVFGMQVTGASRTITAPAGYTQVFKNETGTWGYYLYSLIRGASPPGSSWTSTVDDQLSAFAVTYRGVDTASPIATHTINSGTSAGPGTITWTGLTTTAANTMVVGGILSTGHVTLSSMTIDNLRSGVNGSTYTYGYDEVVASAGATGNFTATMAEASPWAAVLVALRAAGGGGPAFVAARPSVISQSAIHRASRW